MSIHVKRPSVTMAQGGVWIVDIKVRDNDCVLTDVTPSLTITPPTGSNVTPTIERTGTGQYRAVYQPTLTGRYVGVVTATNLGTAFLSADVSGITLNADMPNVQDVRDYLKVHTSWEDSQIQNALDAETRSQRNRCCVGASLNADLREALMRRVACNLGRRAITVGGVQQGDAEGSPPLPTNDPEIRRLELPYRKVVIG